MPAKAYIGIGFKVFLLTILFPRIFMNIHEEEGAINMRIKKVYKPLFYYFYNFLFASNDQMLERHWN